MIGVGHMAHWLPAYMCVPAKAMAGVAPRGWGASALVSVQQHSPHAFVFLRTWCGLLMLLFCKMLQ